MHDIKINGQTPSGPIKDAAVRAFWRNIVSRYPYFEDAVNELDFVESYDDHSFDYEYGSIRATHRCGEWVSNADGFDGSEVDFFVIVRPAEADDEDYNADAVEESTEHTVSFENCDSVTFAPKDVKVTEKYAETFEFDVYDEEANAFQKAVANIMVVKYSATLAML